MPGKFKITTGDAVCTNCVAGKYSTQVGAVSDVCQPSQATDAVQQCRMNGNSTCVVLGTNSTRSWDAGQYAVDGNVNIVYTGSEAATSYLEVHLGRLYSIRYITTWVKRAHHWKFLDEAEIRIGNESGCDDSKCANPVVALYQHDWKPILCAKVGQYVCIHGTSAVQNQSYIKISELQVGGHHVQCRETCMSGWTNRDDANDCTPCVSGKYKSAYGSVECSNCPSKSNAPEGSTTQTDCTCNAGSTRANPDTCTECIAGKYKVPTGDDACTNCVTGQYSTALGATSDVCQSCPVQSNAQEASSECTCNAGFTGAAGDICTQCVRGKYKIATGDGYW